MVEFEALDIDGIEYLILDRSFIDGEEYLYLSNCQTIVFLSKNYPFFIRLFFMLTIFLHC